MAHENQREYSGLLQSMGYRANTRQELFSSLPLQLLCDLVYWHLVKDLDAKQRRNLDEQLDECEVTLRESIDDRMARYEAVLKRFGG